MLAQIMHYYSGGLKKNTFWGQRPKGGTTMLPVRFVRNGLENWLEQPFGSLTRWSDFDGICDRVLGSGTHGGFCVDIRHQDDDLIIEAELPGVNKENIEITAEQNVLTISAKYNEEKKEEFKAIMERMFRLKYNELWIKIPLHRG